MWNNEIIMQYNNNFTTIPQYIKTFMRIVGIYVHEKYLEKQENKTWPKIIIDDLEYNITADNKSEIINIINFLCNNEFITNSEKETLHNLVNIYDDNNILQLILSTRYNVISKELFKKSSKKIENVFDIIYSSCKSNDYYKNFSIMYLAFECNFPLSLIEEIYTFDCHDLLKNINTLSNTLSKNLLIGETYNVLLKKPEIAKEYYYEIPSTFGYYKLGRIFLEVDKKYETADHCFTEALKRNPYYTKARYFFAKYLENIMAGNMLYDYVEPEYKKILFSNNNNNYLRVSDYYLKYIAFCNFLNIASLHRPGASITYYRYFFYFYNDTKKLSNLKETPNYKLLKDWINSVNLEDSLHFYERQVPHVFRGDKKSQTKLIEEAYKLVKR